MQDTKSQDYAHYLIEKRNRFRTKFLQLPYQTHLRFLRPGKTLEIGCGAGRNLVTLNKESVGIDHNPLLVNSCRDIHLNAYTTEEWDERGKSEIGTFDSILIAHVAEHLTSADFTELLKKYSIYLKNGGRFIIICPQEVGYASDPTHVEFMDFIRLEKALLNSAVGSNFSMKVERKYSYPFPRFMGKIFIYNEFIVIGRKRDA